MRPLSVGNPGFGRRMGACAALLAWLLVTPPVPAQAQTLNPENGHYYQRVDVAGGKNWHNARDAAANMTFMGRVGHLATITSAAENAFIVSALGGSSTGRHWLGGYQTGGPEPAGGWTWITGEAFTYTNWAPGQPDDGGGNEQALEFIDPIHGVGLWNDPNEFSTNQLGYIVEFSAVPEPASVFLLLPALAVAGFLRSRRERRER